MCVCICVCVCVCVCVVEYRLTPGSIMAELENMKQGLFFEHFFDVRNLKVAKQNIDGADGMMTKHGD